MRREKPNPPIPASASGNVEVPILKGDDDLSSQTSDVVIVATEDGIVTYVKQEDGTYLPSSVDGEHTQVILDDITTEEIEGKWND